jgi:hypothetical protein
VTELPFFATKVRLGRGGAEEILPLGPLNDFERYLGSTHLVTIRTQLPANHCKRLFFPKVIALPNAYLQSWPGEGEEGAEREHPEGCGVHEQVRSYEWMDTAAPPSIYIDDAKTKERV